MAQIEGSVVTQISGDMIEMNALIFNRLRR